LSLDSVGEDFTFSGCPFVRPTDLVTTISHDRLEQSGRNLQENIQQLLLMTRLDFEGEWSKLKVTADRRVSEVIHVDAGVSKSISAIAELLVVIWHCPLLCKIPLHA